MTPTSYITINGTSYFHYKFSELREYINNKSNRLLLTKITDTHNYYRHYDSDGKIITTIIPIISHFGHQSTPEQYLSKPLTPHEAWESRVIIINNTKQ